MTSYFPNYEEIKKEQHEKEAAGYIILGSGTSNSLAGDLKNRISSIKVEAIAADLIWDEDSGIVSMRDRGITKIGEKFFMLSNGFMHGPWHEFYVKPGMLPELVNFLDAIPKAIKARSAHEQQENKFQKKRAKREADMRQQAEEKRASEEKIRLEQLKLKKDNHLKVGKPEILETNNESHQGDLQEDADTLSPSAIAIFLGFTALIVLAFAKVIVEHKHGSHVSDRFFEPLLIAIFAGVPLFIALRFLFKEEISEAPQRLKSFIIGVFIFLILGSIISQFGGGGTFCAYIVGCI